MNAPSAIIQFTQEELSFLLDGINALGAKPYVNEGTDRRLLELEKKLKQYYYDEYSVQFTLDVTITAPPETPTEDLVALATKELNKRGIPTDAIKEFYTYVDGEEV